MPRPKKPADELLSETIRARATLADSELLADKARRARISEGEFLRHLIRETPLPAQAGGVVDPALVNALNNAAVAMSKVGNNVNQLAASTHQGRDFVRYWREIGVELEAEIKTTRAALVAAAEGIRE